MDSGDKKLFLDLVKNFNGDSCFVEALCIYSIWPLIGRCYRRKTDSVLTQSIEGGFTLKPDKFYHFYFRLKKFIRRCLIRRRFTVEDDSKQKILFPTASPRISSVIKSFTTNHGEHILVSGQHCKNNPRYVDLDLSQYIPLHVSHRNANMFVTRVQKLFESHSVKLNDEELKYLRDTHLVNQQQFGAVRSYLSNYLPKVVVVHADNHPLHQTYVLAAKSLTIPTVMLQHGLDCESYTLEEAYADHLLLWGKQRLERYRKNSTNQRFIASVIGNPEYDNIQNNSNVSRSSNLDKWLWATRPHSSNKSYTANRWPDEGLRILKAFSIVLREFPNASLMIKPHPYEDIHILKEFINELPKIVQAQIQFYSGSFREALESAEVVFSEDSSAGLDAMLASKPLIHIHFCKDIPSMPFTVKGGALYAGCLDELRSAIKKIITFESIDLQKMFEAQRSTIKYLSGNMDGLATHRAVQYIKSLVNLSQSARV